MRLSASPIISPIGTFLSRCHLPSSSINSIPPDSNFCKPLKRGFPGGTQNGTKRCGALNSPVRQPHNEADDQHGPVGPAAAPIAVAPVGIPASAEPAEQK